MSVSFDRRDRRTPARLPWSNEATGRVTKGQAAQPAYASLANEVVPPTFPIYANIYIQNGWGFRSYSPLYINITYKCRLYLMNYQNLNLFPIFTLFLEKLRQKMSLYFMLYYLALQWSNSVSTNLVLPWLWLWSLSHYIHNIEILRINNHENNSGVHFKVRVFDETNCRHSLNHCSLVYTTLHLWM